MLQLPDQKRSGDLFVLQNGCVFMKRLLPLLLTAVILVSLFAFPVLADEVDSNWFNMLDYTYASSGKNYITWEPTDYYEGYFFYHKPVKLDIEFFDIIFYTDDPDPKLYNGSTYAPVINLGDGYYRTYGLDARDDEADSWFFLAFHLSSGSYLEILELNVSTSIHNTYPVTGTFTGYNGSEGVFTEMSFNNTGSVTQYFTISSSDKEHNGGYFEGHFNFNQNWKTFDFIELDVSFGYGEIRSISCDIAGKTIPVEVSYFGYDTEHPAIVRLTVRIDLTGIDRNSLEYPILTITGNGIAGNNLLSLHHAYGYVSIDQPSTELYFFNEIVIWFQSIKSSIDSWGQAIIDALAPSVDVEAFNDQVSDSLGQLNEAGEVMSSVSRPDVSSVDFDVAAKVPTAGLSSIASIVTVVYENPVLGSLMLMFFTLSLAAFVIFGRS